MAWNQPDGNGDRDPWGNRNRGQQQGPPDLDEILRKLQAQWGRVFGRRPGGAGRSRGGGSGRGFGGFGRGGSLGAGLVAVVLLAAWWLGGIWIIQEPEKGVVLRFGAYHRTMDPGFNWAPLLHRFGDHGERGPGPQRGDRLPQPGQQRRRGSSRGPHADRGREHRRPPVRGAVPGEGPRAVPLREQRAGDRVAPGDGERGARDRRAGRRWTSCSPRAAGRWRRRRRG